MPTDKYGFPVGAHAAGAYQFLQSTWDREAQKLGLHDFSPYSQNLAAWDLAATTYQQRTGHSLEGDLATGNVSDIVRVLRDQWTSLNPAFADRLQRLLSERQSSQQQDRTNRLARDNRLRKQNQSLQIINSTGGSATIVGAGLGAAYG